MITRINQSKILTEHFTCNCTRKVDDRKCNFDKKCRNGKCQCEYKNPITNSVCKKVYVWNPSACFWESDKYWEMNIRKKASTWKSLKMI